MSLLPLAALLTISPLWAWANAEPRTAEHTRAHQIYRTPNFSIEHSLSREWATELGLHLERLARQFPAAAATLGVEPSDAGGDDGALRWRCLAAPGAFSGRSQPMLQASYSARRHEVTLMWTPDLEAAANADAGFVPDAPDMHLERSAPLMLRISHELAHQLAFDSNLQKRGVMYPVWLAEGLAANFESPGERLQYLGPNPAREQRLARLARRGSLLPLSRLAVIAEARGLPRQARIDLYAQAWGFYRFLADTRNRQLKSHLRMLAALPPGPRSEQALRRELVRSFGTIPELERAWLNWVSRMVSGQSS